MTKSTAPVVHVVDDDEALRDSLRWMLESAGYRVVTYATSELFLADYDPRQSGCLVLDIRMPGMSGLEVQDELKRRGYAIPIVFITGHGDVPMAVSAMKKGAIDFIEKPFNDEAFIRVVENALTSDTQRRRAAACLATLTARERDVLQGIVAGKRNKVIAVELGVSIKTVEAHRGNVMKKLGVDSLADLMRLTHLVEPRR
jgi:FixJ family two-component response regulator